MAQGLPFRYDWENVVTPMVGTGFDNALKGATASPTFVFRARPFGHLSPFDLFDEQF